MREVHCESVRALFPGRILGPRDLAMPLEHVETAIRVFGGFGNKSKRMVTSPLFALFFESIDDKFVDLFFFSHKKS